MLYQKLLMGNKPYRIFTGSARAFQEHRHSEIELSFCLEGSYDIICENKRYSLNRGDLAVIMPMVAHEIPSDNGACDSLTVEVGYALIGEYFEPLTTHKEQCLLYDHTQLPQPLSELLFHTAGLHKSNSDYSELSVKGNLYHISAFILQMLHPSKAIDAPSRKLIELQKIDPALDIIYNRYYEPLTVEEISLACGYSKSNFCKIFKAVTGHTFHYTLNRHRIEIACMLLKGSDDSIEKIATKTGFSDTRSFCRTFKSFMGESAGVYKKRTKAQQRTTANGSCVITKES